MSVTPCFDYQSLMTCPASRLRSPALVKQSLAFTDAFTPPSPLGRLPLPVIAPAAMNSVALTLLGGVADGSGGHLSPDDCGTAVW